MTVLTRNNTLPLPERNFGALKKEARKGVRKEGKKKERKEGGREG